MAEPSKKRRIEGCKCSVKKHEKEAIALEKAEKFVEDQLGSPIEDAIKLYKAAGKGVTDLVEYLRTLAVQAARTTVAIKVVELMDDYHSQSDTATFDVFDDNGEKVLTINDEDHDAIIEELSRYQTIKVQIAEGHAKGMHVILSLDLAKDCLSSCDGLVKVLEKARSLERKLLGPKAVGK